MSLVAVLPVKRFSSAKARLADDGLSAGERVALATSSTAKAPSARAHSIPRTAAAL
ncbi:MAG: hypothetical protein ACKOTH_05515 [Solirubrobacterales bacterium]